MEKKNAIDKKALIAEYKTLVPPKGVYIVRCKANDRYLLGSTLNITASLNKHKFEIKYAGMGPSIYSELMDDRNKYGADAFEFEILETLKISNEPDYDYLADLEILEMLWVDKMADTVDKNYYKKLIFRN